MLNYYQASKSNVQPLCFPLESILIHFIVNICVKYIFDIFRNCARDLC